MSNYVMPGAIIASEEEYIEGAGTYTDDDGNVRSTKIGQVKNNDYKKSISVYGGAKKFRVGDVIEGKVINVKDKIILVSTRSIKRRGERVPNTAGVVALFISNSAKKFVDSTQDVARIGDIVSGKITKVDKNMVDISTNFPEYGVKIAYCTKCRHKLEPRSKKAYGDLQDMFCPNCKNVEKRKTSNLYLF